MLNKSVKQQIRRNRDNAEMVLRRAADTIQSVPADEMHPDGIVESALNAIEIARNDLLAIQVMHINNYAIDAPWQER